MQSPVSRYKLDGLLSGNRINNRSVSRGCECNRLRSRPLYPDPKSGVLGFNPSRFEDDNKQSGLQVPRSPSYRLVGRFNQTTKTAFLAKGFLGNGLVVNLTRGLRPSPPTNGCIKNAAPQVIGEEMEASKGDASEAFEEGEKSIAVKEEGSPQFVDCVFYPFTANTRMYCLMDIDGKNNTPKSMSRTSINRIDN